MSPPPGVQNERTSLAWTRTGLGLAGCALLTGRLAIQKNHPWAVAAAITAALLAVGFLAWSHDRYRRAQRRLEQRHPVAAALPALVLTAAVTVVGLLALLLITL
ncbi:DUF202 domain-containing protein [Actinophytocola sp.]|uniref:DUF202 domain-containing protein n=1 Tax=Actinophytocola sp. TaxID=1872138 RepID=UPI00389AAA0C